MKSDALGGFQVNLAVPTEATIRQSERQMPRYSFRISRNGTSEPGSITECSGDVAAREEAAGMFADYARTVAEDLEECPQWQIEVANEAGEPIFRLTVLAESVE